MLSIHGFGLILQLLLFGVGVKPGVGQPVVCNGTGTTIQTGMKGVSGAFLNSRTPAAQSGPNLILNGDFSFMANGSDANPPIVNGYDFAMGVLTQENGNDGPQYVAMASWTTSGGGIQTYASWGGDTMIKYTTGWDPTAKDAGASESGVYFGNAYWMCKSGCPITFDGNGYATKTGVSFDSGDTPANFGTTATPVTVSQTVQGLTVGHTYRLQFFCGGEGVDNDGNGKWTAPGVAAIDVSGFDRVFFEVPYTKPAYYRTIDFEAKSTSHTISFLSWGHINPGRCMFP